MDSRASFWRHFLRSFTVLLLAVPSAAVAETSGALDDAVRHLAGELPRSDAPFECGTAELLRVQESWDELSEAQRASLGPSLAPAAAVEARGGGGVPCFLQLENVVESEHFTVQWGNQGGTDTLAAEYLLAGLEAAREVYLDAGYAEALGNPGIKVPFYLGNSGGGAPTINFSGGYTTVCNSYEHAFVVLSGISGDNSTVDVGNHELFHAVQMGSPAPYDVDGFYWEASATWAEDLAEPDFNYHQWFLPSYTSHTQWALDFQDNTESGFLHPYAMFILPSFIEEWSPSGSEALLFVWNGSGGGLVERLETAWRDHAHDTDFAHEFGRFTAHVSVMDFEDQLTYDFARVPPREVLEPPASVDEQSPPQWYGSHFFRVDPSPSDVLEGKTKLRVTFDGDRAGWVVALNRSTDGNTALPTVLRPDEDGLLEFEAIDVGTLYLQTWLIVTNVYFENADYDLQVELVEQTELPGSDIDPPDAGSEGQGSQAGCRGLRQHPFGHQPAAAFLPLLLAFPVLRRRAR